MMRLNKYLATCGVASRRGADALIEQGRVQINGTRVTQLGVSVNERNDQVTVDGKPVSPILNKVYIMMNKPKGIITTAKDEHGRKHVMDMIHIRERVFPVGRLDRNSEGLLFLTNDGEMANRLLHPRYKVSKTYRVKLDRPFDSDDMDSLVSGIQLEDGVTAPCRARMYSPERVELQIREGRKHQVRRMFQALGYEVKALKRTQFGPLTLKHLDRGKWRLLSRTEVWQLRKAVDLIKDTTKQKRAD